jgi:HAD superfamily hydrolase (TIGR01509 family)
MIQLPALHGLLFDAGDVLYYRPRRGQAVQAFLTSMGLKLIGKTDELTAMQRKSYTGECTQRDFYRRRLELSGLRDPVALEQAVDIMVQAQGDIELHEGVAPTLLELRQRGFKLGIVTNTNDSTQSKIQWFSRFGIEGVWSSFATSCELRCAKPDPAIYQAALEPFQVKPDEVAFVAHAAVELAGAKALGMHTISFNPDAPFVRGDAHAERFNQLLQISLKASC